MKIVIYEPEKNEEEKISMRVYSMSEKMLRAIEILKGPEDLNVYIDNKNFKLAISEVFYVESVDFKTFVCVESTVYQSRLKLYQIEETLVKGNFLRISRQVIVNLNKIRNVSSAGGGRIEIKLINNEKLIVSRQYASALKKRFGL